MRSKLEKEQFKLDYEIMGTYDLGRKYLMCEHKVRQVARDLGIYKNKTGKFKPSNL